MVARAGTMSTTPPPPASSPSRRPVLPRWVGAVFPIILLAAVGFWQAYVINRTIVPFALALAVSAGLGALAGFTARWALRGRNFVVRILTAWAALTVGLLLLGLLTAGEAGISLSLTQIAGPNVRGLVQLSVGALTAILALRAWRVRVRPAGEAPQPTLANRWQAFTGRLSANWQATGLYRWLNGLQARFHPPAGEVQVAPSRPARSQRSTSTRSEPRTAPRAQPDPTPPAAATVVQPRTNRREDIVGWIERLGTRSKLVLGSRKNSLVKVGEVAEQRCPYCFDVIQKDDPRGIVVCPICKTPHHADCWAVTGMCQIPHSHT